MGGSRRSGARIGMIVLGVLIILAALLWALFWAILAAWASAEATLTPASGVFVGTMLAVGLGVLVLGMCLVVGRFARPWVWVVVAAVAVVTAALLAHHGGDLRDHVAAVKAAVAVAYEERTGVRDVNPGCVWEYDRPSFDTHGTRRPP
jgi:hypothetical protein